MFEEPVQQEIECDAAAPSCYLTMSSLPHLYLALKRFLSAILQCSLAGGALQQMFAYFHAAVDNAKSTASAGARIRLFIFRVRYGSTMFTKVLRLPAEAALQCLLSVHA